MENEKKRTRVWKLLLVNGAFLFAGVVALELIFGSWVRPHHLAHLNIPRDCTIRYDASTIYGATEPVVYTRDRWGLRGHYESTGDIDIITMGGSATDQRYIPDGQTWQDVIAREFAAEGKKVTVVNAGIDGQSTYGHLKNLDWWFPAIPGLKVKYVLYYIGSNDIYKGGDSDFDALVYENQPKWKGKIKDCSAVYHVIRTVTASYQAMHVRKLSHRYTDLNAWQWTTDAYVADPESLVAERLDRYRRAVAMLAEKTRAMGAVPIFVGQSLSVYRPRPDGTMEGKVNSEDYDGATVNGLDLYHILRIFWRVTREECEKSGGVFIDAGNEMVWQPGDFYDTTHNTPQGCERLGKYLHAKLAGLPLGDQGKSEVSRP